LFSSEVSFTQEMLLWEDGQQRRMDIRQEPDHESVGDSPEVEEAGGGAGAELEAAGLGQTIRPSDR
jgi:hypothetical protein